MRENKGVITEVWQRLTRLESHDLVKRLFNDLHDRDLSSERNSQIRAAARQSREYFRQADTASAIVRPLLTYYGVASLSRSLTLLLKRDGGEGTLSKGHGVETRDWSALLTNDIGASLPKVASLGLRTCKGLFLDLMVATRNRICLHVHSSAVDWNIEYKPLTKPIDLKVSDLYERLPDLDFELVKAKLIARFSPVNEMSCDDQNGFTSVVSRKTPISLRGKYESYGYIFQSYGQLECITATTAVIERFLPQFSHAYVKKTFGSIPSVHLVEPFEDGICVSQLGMTYLTSYFLGMLARYYPTHWIALIDGGKGDLLWPTLKRAQQYVETVFPELVAEFIDEAIANPLCRTERPTLAPRPPLP